METEVRPSLGVGGGETIPPGVLAGLEILAQALPTPPPAIAAVS